MKVCTIYKLVCTINGKPYIGFTTQTLGRRWYGHVSEARYRKTYHRPLISAIRKYGPENFTKEVLYCSKDFNHTLEVMERHFIEVHKSHITHGGYNLNFGGAGSYGHRHKSPRSPEHCEKIRQARLGTKHSEEHKAKIAAAGRGRKHTPETIMKMKSVKRSEEFKAARRAYKVSPEFVAQRVANRTKPTWTVQMPDGTIITTNHIKQTCTEHGVAYIALHTAFKNGRGINRGPSKGWQLLSVTPSKNGHAIR